MDTTEAARICGQAAKTLAEALGRETDAIARLSLASALSAVSGRMDPTQAAKTLAEALGRTTDTGARSSSWTLMDFGINAGSVLASALSGVASRMDPTEAARICGQAAKTLAEALGRETDAYARSSLASALSTVAGRMDPAQAARICAQAAKVLAEALGRETDARARSYLASALSEVAGRMDPTESAPICSQAVKTLAEALGHETNAYARLSLASALSAVAGRMDPREAARVCAQAAEPLAEALGHETNNNACSFLTSALSAVVGRMAPAAAAPVCGGIMRLSVQKGVAMARAGGPWGDPSLVPGLLRYLDPARANALTREVVTGIVSRRNVNESWPGGKGLGLSAILDDTSMAEISRRAGFRAMMIGQVVSGQFAWAGTLAAEPFPCRLTTQELVDLLKMPTCFGPARWVVLDHLGNRYGRRFVNHWAFVRYAQERGLDLDFTTPPKRPDPRESVKRMLEILDRSDAR